MQRLWNIFVMLTTAAHMVFGCCLHHGHTCWANCSDSPSPQAESCACSAHQHEHHDGDQDGGSSDTEWPKKCPYKHECNGTKCVFIRSESSEVGAEQSDHQFVPLTIDLVSFETPLLNLSSFGVDDRSPPSAHPSRRLHLLKQVLLI